MCGVVGYIGKSFCRDFIVTGLSQLEYRGYDSAGIACIEPENNNLVFLKSEGKLQNLIDKLSTSQINGYNGIGHTRWSTHGIVSEQNAHPHFDCQKKIAIVHNGIIENHNNLRESLETNGHKFYSTTDTEVIAHLFECLIDQNDSLFSAVINLVNKLDGAYAFAALVQNFPDQLVIARKKSPLCIGIGENEMFIGSDILAFQGQTNKILFMPDESFAIIKKNEIQLFNFNGNSLSLNIQEISNDWQNVHKNNFESFMLKEIYEQKQVIKNCINSLNSITNLFKQLNLSTEFISNIKTINIIGCGTSWHAARIAQFYFENICMIPTHVYLASEFRYMPFFPDQNSLYIAVSQSGETADTLEALRLINSMNCKTLAISNVNLSSMVREANGYLLSQAGPEIAVASTKSFTSQLTVFYWLCNKIANIKKIISHQEMLNSEYELLQVAEILENCIENYKIQIINELAIKYSKYKKFIFLGRHISYPLALEASLKLKEISYIFSQCYPAGELKHGPIALLDEETPVVLLSNLEPIIYQKLVSNAQEVKSRKGHLIVFAYEGQKELIELADTVFIIPAVNKLLGPIAMTGLIQFFVYQIAKVLGRSIDKPRNLAKSVTVE